MGEGTIIKALSGFYTVADGSRRITCKAKGRFRHVSTSPLVGDHVTYSLQPDATGTIDAIAPRKNSFIRPAVANIDAMVYIAGAAKPVTDPFLIDRFSVIHKQSRGENRGFVIAYGKNLIDLEQEHNIAEMYNGVLPYVSINGVTSYGAVQMAAGTWSYYRILPVDFSSEWSSQTAPTQQEFAALASAYITRKHLGEPEISIKVQTVPPGSEGIQSLSQLQLGDTVKVRFEGLGIDDVPTNVVAYTYDVLREQYTSIDLGKKPRSAAEAIADAGRLSKGEIPPARIGGGSIGGGKLKDAAITEGKIRGNAVTYDKLALAVQSLFVDILEANEIYAAVISSDHGISCSTIVVSGEQYLPGSWTFIDGLGNDRTFYGLKKAGT